MSFVSPGINELRAVSDVSSIHVLKHYLYFADESNSSKASQRLVKRGFQVINRPSADGETWLVLASHIAVPTEERIGAIRADLEKLAEEHGGEYDGWEAEIIHRSNQRSSMSS